MVFDREGRVLLIRRVRPPSAGLWHVPGGRVEPGEGMVAACRREVREETGLEVSIGPILAVVERRLEGFHYIVIDFLGRLDGSAAAVAGDDAGAVAWVAPERLADYPVAEGLVPIVARARMLLHGWSGGLHDRSGSGTDFVASVVPAAAP